VFGDPCSGYYKRLYVIATCTNSRAASGHHIHRHTDGSLYYTTSRSVLYVRTTIYQINHLSITCSFLTSLWRRQVAPQNSPGALPTTVLNLGGSGTTGFLRQSTYAKFWIFGPNCSYLLARQPVIIISLIFEYIVVQPISMQARRIESTNSPRFQQRRPSVSTTLVTMLLSLQ
jgi:hypothetical protein